MAQVSNIVLQTQEPNTSVGDHIQRIQAQKQAILRKQEADQDDLMKYAAGQLDFGKYATGTPSDEMINGSLNNILQETAAKIRNNKGEGYGSLIMDLQQKVGALKQQSNNAILTRKQIEQNAKEIAKETGADENELVQDGMRTAFLKQDPNTGQIGLNDNVDPSMNYVGKAFALKPQNYIKNLSRFVQGMSKLPANDFSGSEGYYERPGVKKTGSWSAKNILPFQEVVKEKDGLPITTRVMSEPIKIKGADGKEQVIQGLPKGIYDQFIGSSGYKYDIEAELHRQLKSNPKFKDVNPYGPEADDLKRVLAYDILKAYYPDGAGFDKKENETRSALVTKIELGIPSGGTSAKQQDATDYVQAYAAIDEITKRHAAERRRYTQANLLPNKAQDAVLTVVRGKLGTQNIGIQDIKLVRDGSGNIVVVAAKNIYDGTAKDAPLILAAEKPITSLDKVGTDLSVNKTAKEKKEILKDGQPKKLTIKRSDISAKAAAAGYSAKDYEKLLRDKGVEIVN